MFFLRKTEADYLLPLSIILYFKLKWNSLQKINVENPKSGEAAPRIVSFFARFRGQAKAAVMGKLRREGRVQEQGKGAKEGGKPARGRRRLKKKSGGSRAMLGAAYFPGEGPVHPFALFGLSMKAGA
ncbi:MAG: hypothetical protein IKI64_09000 [Clostridia bacterium]|nr:hypothetical protein [Clostridia bacterium]